MVKRIVGLNFILLVAIVVVVVAQTKHSICDHSANRSFIRIHIDYIGTLFIDAIRNIVPRSKTIPFFNLSPITDSDGPLLTSSPSTEDEEEREKTPGQSGFR